MRTRHHHNSLPEKKIIAVLRQQVLQLSFFSRHVSQFGIARTETLTPAVFPWTLRKQLQDKQKMPSTECRVHVHFTVHKNIEEFQSKAEEMIKIIKVGE